MTRTLRRRRPSFYSDALIDPEPRSEHGPPPSISKIAPLCLALLYLRRRCLPKRLGNFGFRNDTALDALKNLAIP